MGGGGFSRLVCWQKSLPGWEWMFMVQLRLYAFAGNNLQRGVTMVTAGLAAGRRAGGFLLAKW